MNQIHYKGRQLQVLCEDGFVVKVLRDGREIYSTAPHLLFRETAIEAAKKLVDDEIKENLTF